MILVILLLVFSKVLTTTPRQFQCSAERNFSTTIFVEQFSMAAPTNKKSILIGTRSIQNSKRCFVNNENVKLVKLFPLLNYFLLLFLSGKSCRY